MRKHTQSFKEQIKKMGREINSRITYGNNILTSEELYSIYPIINGSLLNSAMKELQFESSVQVPNNTLIKYEFGLKVNGEYEYLDYGVYIVYSSEFNEDTKTYKHTCYDGMLFTMKKYTSLQNGKFPMTIREYITNLCLDCNLIFKNFNDEFPNYNKIIETDLYANLDYTYRDIFDELSAVTASTICLNSSEQVEVRYVTETNDAIDAEYLKDVNVKFGEKYGPINSIVLSRSAESDNVYLRDEESVANNGLCELKIIDNQIMNDNNRSDYLPDILDKLNGLEYHINDYTSTGVLYYEICDKYKIQIEDKIYTCVLLNDEPEITQGIVEKIFTEMPEETTTDYTKADKTDRRINQAYILVNKQNKKIEAIATDVNSNKEKVASLEMTTSNISTKVSSVETNLSTTNSNLSNLSSKVDTLNKDIQGVSADFEEFKDNEYIQSIDNLQKQIDGAIQFWNGAEIPTLNNYPTNEWTTEKDKINHQADIYTVVQDIEGEMKQGKSYRFDKIDGVWQWIELTDNELSAVQAIAQEALNKANSNNEEIGTIKTKVSTLEQSDEQIKASIESIDKEIIPTSIISGSDIYIKDGSNNPLINLEIEGKSKQETRSGKNLVDFGNPVATYNATSTFVDDILTVTQTESITYSNVSFNILNVIKNNPGKTLKFCCESYDVSNFTSSVSTLAQIVLTINGSNTYQDLFNSAGTTTWYTIPDDVSNITMARIRMMTNNSSTTVESSSFTMVKPMLIFSTENEEYEKYGVSPSPDYPSEIESVGYENLYQTPDSLVVDGITYTKKENGMFDIKGTGQSTIYEYVNNLLYVDISDTKLIDGETYTFSVNQPLPDGLEIMCEAFDDTSWLKHLLGWYLNSNRQQITSKIDLTNVTRIRFVLRVLNGYTVDIQNLGIMLVKGKVSRSYIPCNKYGVEVIHRGENLYNYEDIASISDGATTDENGWTTITYDNTEGTAIKYVNYFTNNLQLKTLTKYNIIVEVKEVSGEGWFNVISCYTDKNGNKFGQFNDSKWYGLKNLSNESIFQLFSTSRDDFTDITYGLRSFVQFDAGQKGSITFRISVLEDTTITADNFIYESYVKNISVLSLNEPLRSLSDGTKDRLYIQNGKLYVNRRIGRAVLDGSEDWSNGTSGGFTRFYTSIADAITSTSRTIALSNYFHHLSSGNKIGACFINDNRFFAYPNANITTTADFKTWLSENNVEVLYELAEPILEEVGNLEMPSTFKGTNHISTTDKLEPIINIEYVRDTTLSNYVENQINNSQVILTNEMNAKFDLQQEKIDLELSKKVNGDEIIASINMSTEKFEDGSTLQIKADKIDLKGKKINLTSDEIVIESENFSVTKEGKITSTSGEIGGYTIGEKKLYANIKDKYTYTTNDCNRIISILSEEITPTEEDYEKLDLNKDGEINLTDYVRARRKRDGVESTQGTITINTEDANNIIVFEGNTNNIHTSIGMNQITTNIFTAKDINTKSLSIGGTTQPKIMSGTSLPTIANDGEVFLLYED